MAASGCHPPPKYVHLLYRAERMQSNAIPMATRQVQRQEADGKTGDRRNVPQCFDEWKCERPVCPRFPSDSYAAETDSFLRLIAGRRSFRSASSENGF
jgi:hypothetical protein